MSTKFNRNDSNAADDQFYADDYKTDLNGVEEDLRTSLGDLHAMPCIISGLVLTVNTGDDSLFDVSSGLAYDEDGYRIEIPSDQLANSGADTANGAINYICVRHKNSYDTSRNAYKIGVSWNTRKFDDFEIVVRTEAQGVQAGDVCLGTSTGNGSGISVSTENRTQPDFSGAVDTAPPAKVTGVNLLTGDEPTYIFNDPANPISSQVIDDFTPARAWIKVTFNEVTDPSGIREYQVELIPLYYEVSEVVEKEDLIQSQTINYSPAAPGGPEY